MDVILSYVDEEGNRVATDTVFKAYDVRGTYPDQIDAELCRAFGAAFARQQVLWTSPALAEGAHTIVIEYTGTLKSSDA